MKFTLISSQILQAKSIVVNKKNHKVVWVVFYEDPIEHLKKFEGRPNGQVPLINFIVQSLSHIVHSSLFLQSGGLKLVQSGEHTTKSMMREPTRLCDNTRQLCRAVCNSEGQQENTVEGNELLVNP